MLNAKNIHNDYGIAVGANTRVYIAPLYLWHSRGPASRNGYKVQRIATSGTPLDDKKCAKFYRWNTGEREPRAQDAAALEAAIASIGGEWERSPFDRNSWHPKGAIAKILGD